jgi:multisubunit Na+/H+ antiporter MnhC subunit
MVVYLLAGLLFGIGLYGVLIKRNLIKIIIGLSIMEYALFLLFALIGYRKAGVAPIITKLTDKTTLFVDPLPQALVLTAIVIGLGTTALIVSIAVRIYEKYGTFDITQVRKLRG